MTPNQEFNCVNAACRSLVEHHPLCQAQSAPAEVAQGEAVACLVRARHVSTYAREAHDGKDHFTEWSEWSPYSLSYGEAVTQPGRSTRLLHEMRPLYTAPPSPDAEVAQVEAVEVVGYCVKSSLENRSKVYEQRQEWAYQEYGGVTYYVDDLMTVAQCNRIVAALTQPSPDAELVGLKSVLPLLDDALEHLESHGQHSDQGYRKLKDWYRKIALATDKIDAKLASLKGAT
jgi:hypothetical protein